MSTCATGWCKVPNDLLTRFGPQIGAYGVAVYACLAMHADRQRRAWPSHEGIAQSLGLSRRQVIRICLQLERFGLISVERFPDRKRPNIYTLEPVPDVTVSHMDVTNSHTSDVTISHRGCDCQSQALVTISHTNKTQLNKTQEQDNPPTPLPTEKADPQPTGKTPSHRSNLECDNVDLVPAARRIAAAYQEAVQPAHGSGGAVPAIIGQLQSGQSEERLINAAKGYAQNCVENDRPAKFRKSCLRFYEPFGPCEEYLGWVPAKKASEMTYEELRLHRRAMREKEFMNQRTPPTPEQMEALHLRIEAADTKRPKSADALCGTVVPSSSSSASYAALA